MRKRLRPGLCSLYILATGCGSVDVAPSDASAVVAPDATGAAGTGIAGTTGAAGTGAAGAAGTTGIAGTTGAAGMGVAGAGAAAGSGGSSQNSDAGAPPLVAVSPTKDYPAFQISLTICGAGCNSAMCLWLSSPYNTVGQACANPNCPTPDNEPALLVGTLSMAQATKSVVRNDASLGCWSGGGYYAINCVAACP